MENFIPKQLIHTWTGHTKAITTIRLFPNSAHLLLSGAMDCKIKIWDVYNEREVQYFINIKVKRTYTGHTKGIRDLCFDSEGTRMLSCSYDRWTKLWDVETGIITLLTKGQCLARFNTKKIPTCVQFNPSPDKSHQFLLGSQDRKIHQYDLRTGEIVQTYDQHNGIFCLTQVPSTQSHFWMLKAEGFCLLRKIKHYVRGNGMFLLLSSLLVSQICILSQRLRYQLIVITELIVEKWLACQSLDNKVAIYSVGDRIKVFTVL